MQKKLYYTALAIIVLLSFRLYSALFYPILNSDHAVNILMLHDFRWPEDLYFWGQDRIGSLIPLLGQLFFKGFHWSALTSESVTHYLILLAGFLAFSTFFKSYFFRIIFALVWFMPPMRFIDTIELYSGVEYSLIAIACYLFNRSKSDRINGNVFLRHANLFCITGLLLLAIWVSDMALISVAVLLFVQFFYFLKSNSFSFAKIMRKELVYVIAGVVAGIVFFSFAKSHSPGRLNYTTFSDAANIGSAFGILWKTILDLFTFNGDEFFTSCYLYLLLITAGFIFAYKQKVKLDERQKKWLLFFLLDATLVFLLIMVSKWTYLNGVPRRYFTCTYISLSVVFLMMLEQTEMKRNYDVYLKGMLLATVLTGSISPVYNMKYFWPRTLTPKVNTVAEFETLGDIGIIAEYWNAYIVACKNPDHIKATPHDGEYVRSHEMVEAVFRQKKLYIIKDMWLDTFPDSLRQFNRILIKDGDAFHLGDCEVCKYRKAE